MTGTARRPTIVDVARAASVSKSLVSAALRGEPGVSAASRSRILAAADELGYRSNGWAQRLVSGRSSLVGVLLTDLRNAYQTDIVNGIEDAAAAAGFDVVLSHGRRDRELLRERLASLTALGVDAVIAVTGHLDADDLAALADRVPMVVVGRPASVPDAAGWIRNDDETGARLAVAHLQERGHDRIAYVHGSSRPASIARRDAYRALVTEAREYDVHDDGIARLLDAVAAGGPTAAFAANDRIAAQIVAEAVDRGIRLPHDLAVVGYDNTELADLIRPGLTSVDQPRGEMGAAAMAQALGLLDGGVPEREVASPTLVVRGSS
ncbi:transcriptional regulator [Microbacterium sorbitolivorans]|uniref:LacI family transcriptional regulator n=1 Tax=Microbacterium sorbitolivorans TaxID=1867410 RepID=A0A367Y5P8_9MICO|nr:LacI family DNA-binding transcriptional regulator [Microbacterium sorbitolivorans]RCK61158.1 LacI family transcriptional regulator [Microbacterium sorbitolivorans]GGF34580.1 transcriptional regulator [Microbacterium sorbitolivorans]